MKSFSITECEEGYLVREDRPDLQHMTQKMWCYLKVEDALDRLKKLFDGDDGLDRSSDGQ